MSDENWTATRILTELCSPETRLEVAALIVSPDFPKEHAATIEGFLAEELRFRPQYVRRLQVETKAKYLCKRMHKNALEPQYALGLKGYHFAKKYDLMHAFLDQVGIKHADGQIDAISSAAPDIDKLRSAYTVLNEQFHRQNILCCLATVGLIMKSWRHVLWPMVSEFNSETAAAVESVGIDAPKPTSDNDDEPKVDSIGFTTLDHVIIDQIVASVGEYEGALNQDQISDFVDEVVHLSGSRQRSYFHLGFLQTLLGMNQGFDAPEENLTRRSWFLAGQVMALGRKSKWQGIADLHDANRETFDHLLNNQPECAVMVAPVLFDAYWRLGRVAEAVACVNPGVAATIGPKILIKLLTLVRDTYRTRQVTETRLLIDLVKSAVSKLPSEHAAPPVFVFELRRRHAQCLKAEGHFAASIMEFQALTSLANNVDKADIHTDLGLSIGNFKWLFEVEVPKLPHQIDSMLERIQRGMDCYLEAEKLVEARQTNLQFVLGVRSLLKGWKDEEEYQIARTLFERAYQGASERVVVYRKTGVFARLQLYYALSIMLSLDEPQYRYAIDLLNQAKNEIPPHEWPEWMIFRAADNCVQLGSQGHLDLIAFCATHFTHFLDKWMSNRDLLERSEPLRNYVAQLAVKESVSPASKWDALSALVGIALRKNDVGLARSALDQMESLAAENSKYRSPLIDFLENPSNYRPAWEESEALFARARLLELTGDCQQAANCLLQACHNVLSSGKLDEAEGILDQISTYGLPAEVSQAASLRLAAANAAAARTKKPLGREVKELNAKVLFVGGNEMQHQYDTEITRYFQEHHPKVTITFEHTGWSSNWGRLRSRLSEQIGHHDVVVLMTYIRTELGRYLREQTGQQGKEWAACTGHGRDSCTRAILEAARRFCDRTRGA